MDPILEAINRLATKKARKPGRMPPMERHGTPIKRTKETHKTEALLLAPDSKVSPPPPSPEPPPALPSPPELETGLPRNWRVLVRGRWPAPFEEEWEERSAMMEFEGGLPKDVAERKAYEDMMKRHEGLKRFERELRSHEEDPRVQLLTELFDPRLMAVWWSGQ